MTRFSILPKQQATISLLLIFTCTVSLTSCSTNHLFDYLLGERKSRPTHPGSEHKKGEVKEFTKDEHGEWTSERKYSEQQKKQLKEYQRSWNINSNN